MALPPGLLERIICSCFLSWPIASYLSWPIDRLPIMAESVVRNLRGWLVPARFLGAMWSVNHFVVRHGIYKREMFSIILLRQKLIQSRRQKKMFCYVPELLLLGLSVLGDPTVVNWSGLRRSQMNHPPFRSDRRWCLFLPDRGLLLLACLPPWCDDSTARLRRSSIHEYRGAPRHRVMLKV